MPKIGDSAPQFSLPSSGGGRISLSDYAGKKLVLYFYPKDDTPGCTKEACDFRDSYSTYKSAGAEILGISPDGTGSHDEFKSKYQLPFPLLADEDHAIAEAYGVWKEKTLYGRTFMGIERSTFVIDDHQKIAAIFNRVQVDGHSDHVLSVLKGEQPAPTPVESPVVKSSGRPVGSEPSAASRQFAKPASPAHKPAAPVHRPAPAKPQAKTPTKPLAKPVAKAVAKPAPKKAVTKPTPKKAAPKKVALAKKKPAAKPVKKTAKPAPKKAAGKKLAPKKPAVKKKK